MAKKAHPRTEGNYLKAIYCLATTEPKKVSLTKLAEVLHINPPSILDMIRKLAVKEMVYYDKKKGVTLTEKGNAAALSIVRKHGLWEAFLVEKLGYGPGQVGEIAEQLEYAEGRQLDDRLDKYLGFPENDPHGNPIPKAKE
jgi:DtxR family transcriptional regulator, Mn-dependent transcriptional regulator